MTHEGPLYMSVHIQDLTVAFEMQTRQDASVPLTQKLCTFCPNSVCNTLMMSWPIMIHHSVMNYEEFN